jgi:hypothetical protein
MAPDTPATGSTDPAADAVPEPTAFARLLTELEDLDFEQAHSDDPATTIYTQTDNPLTVEVDNTTTPPTAHLVHGQAGQPPTWRVSFTAATPDPVALMVLWAALGAHLDPHAALESAATAMGVSVTIDQPPPTGT